MTTFLTSPDADVRPDVRTEVHAHRHGKHRRKPNRVLFMRSNWWVALFVALFVAGSGLLLHTSYVVAAA